MGYLIAAAFMFMGYGGEKIISSPNCNCGITSQNIVLRDSTEGKITFRDSGKRCKLKIKLKIDFSDDKLDEPHYITLYSSKGKLFSTVTTGKFYILEETIKLKKGEGAWILLQSKSKGDHIISINEFKRNVYY